MYLTALGSYFKEPDYHYQAVEKFQEGLSIDRTNHKLWYAIAKANLSSALLDQEERTFDNACKFFAFALNLKTSSVYHYHYGLCLSRYGELLQDQEMIEKAVNQFKQALSMQRNAPYLHPKLAI